MSLHITSGSERLAGLDDIKVLGVDVIVLREVVIFLCNKNTLSEQILVDLLAVCFGDEPKLWSAAHLNMVWQSHRLTFWVIW